MSVSAPADRRFRRPSVRPAQRRAAWRALRWSALRPVLVAGLVLGAAAWGTALVTGAGLFRVQRVTVRGNARLSTGEVLALVSGLRHESLLTADLPAFRERLLDSPWVADAALRRVLPSGVEIVVRERSPMGLCRVGGRLYLVDGTGTLIDEYGPPYADLDLPIIDGLTGGAGAPGQEAARADLAARVMRAIAADRTLARRVSQIDVSDPHDAVVILDGDTSLLHVGDTKFAERLQSYLELAPALHARVPDIDYVDLRFDQRVYVRPTRAAASRRQAPGMQDTGSRTH